MRGILCTGEKKCMPTIRSGERASRAHAKARCGRGLSDARAHEAKANDAHVRDRAGLPESFECGLALTQREHHERGQAATGLADRELAERARLGVEAGVDAPREAD